MRNAEALGLAVETSRFIEMILLDGLKYHKVKR